MVRKQNNRPESIHCIKTNIQSISKPTDKTIFYMSIVDSMCRKSLNASSVYEIPYLSAGLDGNYLNLLQFDLCLYSKWIFSWSTEGNSIRLRRLSLLTWSLCVIVRLTKMFAMHHFDFSTVPPIAGNHEKEAWRLHDAKLCILDDLSFDPR